MAKPYSSRKGYKVTLNCHSGYARNPHQKLVCAVCNFVTCTLGQKMEWLIDTKD